MKLRRRLKIVLLLSGLAVAFGYYAAVLGPERRLTSESALLYSLGMPRSLPEAGFVTKAPEQNSAPELEQLFKEWVHGGVRDKHPNALGQISLGSSPTEVQAAKKSLEELEPFLKRFESAITRDSLFEKDWAAPPGDIAFPEITHLRTFAGIYENAAYLAIFHGDKSSALKCIAHIDRIGDHISGTPFLVHRLASGKSRKQASALIEFAAKQWKNDGTALKKLNDYARSRSFPFEPAQTLHLEALTELDSLDDFPNYRYEELSYGPQDGWPRREFRKWALSDSVRRGAKAKLATAWRRLLQAERESGGDLDAIEKEYQRIRRDFSGEWWLTGRLANHAFINLDQVLLSVRTAEDSRIQAIKATDLALEAARRPRGGAASSGT